MASTDQGMLHGQYKAKKRRAQEYQESRSRRPEEENYCSSPKVGEDRLREAGRKDGQAEAQGLNVKRYWLLSCAAGSEVPLLSFPLASVTAITELEFTSGRLSARALRKEWKKILHGEINLVGMFPRGKDEVRDNAKIVHRIFLG